MGHLELNYLARIEEALSIILGISR
ncbi:hypothetical protein [Aphanothece hegewaldii]